MGVLRNQLAPRESGTRSPAAYLIRSRLALGCATYGILLLRFPVGLARRSGRQEVVVGPAVYTDKKDPIITLWSQVPSRESCGKLWGRMFEHYTPRARRALVLAEEEARLLGQDFVGAEHILAGLARAGGRATVALEAVGVDAEVLRQHLRASVRRDPGPVEAHLTADARQVLELALRKADQLGHSSVGAEHLLLAVASLENSAGTQALSSLGIALAELRHEVLQAVREGIIETAPLNEGASQALWWDQHYGGYRSYPLGLWAGHPLMFTAASALTAAVAVRWVTRAGWQTSLVIGGVLAAGLVMLSRFRPLSNHGAKSHAKRSGAGCRGRMLR